MDIPPKTQGTAKAVLRELRSHSSKEKAHVYRSFFKTGKGQYGEGDVFLGVSVPMQRLVVKKFAALPFSEIILLLESSIHEARLAALLILVSQYKNGDEKMKGQIYDLYLLYTRYVNNWDLVDTSAYHIVGEHLSFRKRDVLLKLARSGNIWERRIAIVATFAFIRRGEFQDTFAIAEVLLSDKHDLIHKALGWMLREVGKRDASLLEGFLVAHIYILPRTTLRYAIERFTPEKRKRFLAMK